MSEVVAAASSLIVVGLASDPKPRVVLFALQLLEFLARDPRTPRIPQNPPDPHATGLEV